MRKILVLLAVAFGLIVAGCSGGTSPATNVTSTQATLNGHGKCDGGTPTPCQFEWRIRKVGDSSWFTFGESQQITQNTPDTPLHQDVGALQPGTTYEWQLGGKGDNVSTYQWIDGTDFTTASGSINPSGQNPPSSTPGWTRVGSDEFPTSGGFPTSKWTQYPSNYHDTSGKGTYGCLAGCSISGGVLNLHIAGGNVAAPYPRFQGGSGTWGHDGFEAGMTQGRYSVRFRVPNSTPDTYKIAWLLWPDTDVWPRDGELDFPEVTSFPGEIKAFTHHQGASSGSDQDGFGSGVTIGNNGTWHTATIERLTGSVKYILDGNVVGTSTSRLPSGAMHWVLQTETKVSAGSVPPPSASADVQIDWVTVDKP